MQPKNYLCGRLLKKNAMMKRNLSTTPRAPQNSVRMDLAEQVLRKRLKRDCHTTNEQTKRTKMGKVICEDDKSSVRSTNIDNVEFVNDEVERFREWDRNKSKRERKVNSSGSGNKRSASAVRMNVKKKRIKTTSADPTESQTIQSESFVRKNHNHNCSLFRRRYQRGELPVIIKHNAGGLSLSWSRPLGSMKPQESFTLITTFLDGLRCSDHPYKFIAFQGCYELIQRSNLTDKRILKHFSGFVAPLRRALLTGDEDIVLSAIKILIHLINVHPGMGIYLVPYHRQLIPPILNEILTRHVLSTYDIMGYSNENDDIRRSILEYLDLLEEHGGNDAYQSIKYHIPTYENIKPKGRQSLFLLRK